MPPAVPRRQPLTVAVYEEPRVFQASDKLIHNLLVRFLMRTMTDEEFRFL